MGLPILPNVTSLAEQAALEPEVSGREQSQCVSLVRSSHAPSPNLATGSGR